MSQNMRSRIRELKEIERILSFLQGEIRYKYSMLSEAFSNISAKFGQPFNEWLGCLSDLLCEGSLYTIDKIWHTSLLRLREGTCLKERDYQKISEIGKCLGYLDVDAQLLGIDMERENIKNTIEDLEHSVEQKTKIAVVLGLFLGILVVILML